MLTHTRSAGQSSPCAPLVYTCTWKYPSRRAASIASESVWSPSRHKVGSPPVKYASRHPRRYARESVSTTASKVMSGRPVFDTRQPLHAKSQRSPIATPQMSGSGRRSTAKRHAYPR